MIGEKIRELRKKHKMTQKELAKKLKMTPSAVGMYEQNRREPKYEILEQLSEIFSVSCDYILDRENEMVLNSATMYKTRSSDFDAIIDDLKHELLEQKGLMFKGEILEEKDLEKIFDAMKIGAEVAIKAKNN